MEQTKREARRNIYQALVWTKGDERAYRLCAEVFGLNDADQAQTDAATWRRENGPWFPGAE